ncbi:MAG TPA: S24 family peptidase [Anaerolineae bacterium]
MPALNWMKHQPEELNTVEVKVLDYLAHTLRRGFCPSREELSQAAGLGKRGSSIVGTLRRLEAKGYLDLDRGRTRSITLNRTADGRRFSADTVWVPLAGHTSDEIQQRTTDAPGVDSPAVAEAIELARSMVSDHENVYAFRVRGQTLSDAQVNDGDVVILARTAEVKNGELAAVRVTGKDGRKTTTLKHVYRENGYVRLQPVHPDMRSMYYKSEHVAVQGRVVMVIRKVS